MVIRFGNLLQKFLKEQFSVVPQKSILHLNHSLLFLVQFRTWNLSTLRNCYNQLLPFFYAFLVPYCNEFLRESWRNYICTIFFPRENVLSERENFAAATIIFHFYMYLNDQRVEIYLLNWPNYLSFSFCIPLFFWLDRLTTL